MSRIRLFPDRVIASGTTPLTDLFYGGGQHEVWRGVVGRQVWTGSRPGDAPPAAAGRWRSCRVQLPTAAAKGPCGKGWRRGCMAAHPAVARVRLRPPSLQVVVPLSGEGGRAGHLHLGLLMEKEAQPGEAIGEAGPKAGLGPLGPRWCGQEGRVCMHAGAGTRHTAALRAACAWLQPLGSATVPDPSLLLQGARLEPCWERCGVGAAGGPRPPDGPALSQHHTATCGGSGSLPRQPTPACHPPLVDPPCAGAGRRPRLAHCCRGAGRRASLF